MYKNPKTTDDYLFFIHKFKNFHIMPLYALFEFTNYKNNPLTIVVKGFIIYIFYSHSIVLAV